MNCKAAMKLIPLFVGNDLPGPLAVRVLNHLDGCEACASERRAYEASQVYVKRAAVVNRPPALPVDFAAKVRERIAKAPYGRTAASRKWRATLRERPAVIWAAAAVVMITCAALLNGHLGLQKKDSKETVTQKRDMVRPEEVAASDEPKEDEWLEVSREGVAGLMSRLNPRRDMTDEELDAKYPTVNSVTYPRGTAMIYHTNDPRVTVVWILEPVASAAQKGVGVQ